MNTNVAIWRVRKNVPGVGRKLSRHFDCNEITTQLPKKALSQGAYVINYGRSVIPEWYDQVEAKDLKVLNKPQAVKRSVDKRTSLRLLSEAGVPCLQSTTDPLVAQGWIEAGKKVVARTLVKSKKGKGIKLITSMDNFVQAPLYTLHYEKTHEFRVHVLGGKVVDYVQKKRMGKAKLNNLGLEQADLLIRNHKRGWVFARNDIYRLEEIEMLGLQATSVVGLDLCAVDILARFSDNGEFIDAVVCETNSAPGMSDKNTFNAYTSNLEALMATGGTSFVDDAVELAAAPQAEDEPFYLDPHEGHKPEVVQKPAMDTKEYIKDCLGGWELLSKDIYWNYLDGRIARTDGIVIISYVAPQQPKQLHDAPNYVE